MVMHHPSRVAICPTPPATPHARSLEPAAVHRPCIDALIIGRIVRPPTVAAQETGLVLAVNLATRGMPGTYRRAEHATFLLVHAAGAAHRLFQGPDSDGLCGLLVRICHCALELMPFTTDYETIDHRLQGFFERPEQFTILGRSDHRPMSPDAAPAIGPVAEER